MNSIVAKWLGFQSPVSAFRSAIRGFVLYPDGHGFEPKFYSYFGGGVRYGFIPCDDKGIYWFCTFSTTLFKCKPTLICFNFNVFCFSTICFAMHNIQTAYLDKNVNESVCFGIDDENERDPLKIKQFVISRMGNAQKNVLDVVERTELDCISCAPLKFRSPWNILFGNIVKNNVCVAGDALHPMTPDLGQGACSSIEDAVVLARCLGGALSSSTKGEDYMKMANGLEEYAKERRWRSFSLVSAAYVVGLLQESDNKIVSFFRNKFLSTFTVVPFMRMADFDCGKLAVPST